jgi:hypothetical protein
MTAQRIQRRRVKGWRMPEGAIYVGRPTGWGNPFMAGCRCADLLTGEWVNVRDVQHAVDLYREYAERALTVPLLQAGWPQIDALRGHDLACWCPLTYPDGRPYPCHADVLLEIANA